MVSPGPPRAARWPIRWRLPLLICGLLLVSVATFAVIAYVDLQRALLETAHARLQNLAGQIVGLRQISVQQRLDEIRRLAARPAVRALLDHQDDETRAAARADLEAFWKTSQQTLAVELWSAKGECLIAYVPTPTTQDPNRPSPPLRKQAPTAAGFSSLLASQNIPYYDVIADISGLDGAPAPSASGSDPLGLARAITQAITKASVPNANAAASAKVSGSPGVSSPDASSPGAPSLQGHAPAQARIVPAAAQVAGAVHGGLIVQRRSLYAPSTVDMLQRLSSGSISVRVGSPGDGVWTDLVRVASAPPVSADHSASTDFTDADGVRTLAATADVESTPWVVWVSMAGQDALAPARAFLARMIPLGLGVAAFGAILAWVTARRITEPLHELTHAAEAIAGGDLSGRVASGRGDEIGRLGDAFNIMTGRVADSVHQLDQRVRERTAELERAMTTLKSTQDELVRREKLAMLGQLAGSVGHELRNPLAVMTNAVYFLEMIQRDAAPEVHEYHQLLRAQIGLSEKIVSDLLDFARVKPPRRDTVPLMHIITEQLSRFAVAEGVRIVREIPPDLPPCHVDPIQTGQVVLNLLVNAAQAMEERGGTLTLRATKLTDQLKLDVIDTGPGVPVELQDKIFDALFTTKARGIGLGLAVSRSLAEANGGKLTVSSVPGDGATFTLTLPTLRPEATS